LSVSIAFSGVVPSLIYVATPAGKTIVGTFNVQPATKALFCVMGYREMGFNVRVSGAGIGASEIANTRRKPENSGTKTRGNGHDRRKAEALRLGPRG
jgi:hypothetical protein